MVVSLALVPLLSAAGAAPTFADDYYTGMQTSLVIDQGGYETFGQACCAAGTTGCKIQTSNAGADVYSQGSKNRTRVDSNGMRVMWWEPQRMDMQIVPANKSSAHKYECAEYCSLAGEWYSWARIGDGIGPVVPAGRANVTQIGAPGNTTKNCAVYKWTEHALIIPFKKHTSYVDDSTTPPKPFFDTQIIEPFGKPTGAVGNVSYLGFKTGADVDQYFDIDPASLKSCRLSTRCGQTADLHSSPHEDGTLLHAARPAASMLSVARAQRAALAPADNAHEQPSLTPPTFAKDYTSKFVSDVFLSQGGAKAKANGDVCCDASKAGGCMIQMAHVTGTRYFDWSHKRTRVDEGGAPKQIDDYLVNKSYVFDVHGACAYYCDIHTSDGFLPFSVPSDAKDLGTSTVAGKTVEHYAWKEKVFKIVPVEDVDLYIDNSGTLAVPVKQVNTLLSGPASIGTHNITWTSWVAGTPAASTFALPGMATCTKGDMHQCGDFPSLQHRRLVSGQFHTFAEHHMLYY